MFKQTLTVMLMVLLTSSVFAGEIITLKIEKKDGKFIFISLEKK